MNEAAYTLGKTPLRGLGYTVVALPMRSLTLPPGGGYLNLF